MAKGKNNRSTLSEEELEDLAQAWESAPGEADRDRILVDAGLAPESRGSQGRGSSARQWRRYYEQLVDAAEELLRKRNLDPPEDDKTILSLMEATLAGDEEQAAVEEARLQDPARRWELAEEKLRHHRIRIPTNEVGHPWGIIPPEDEEEAHL